MKSAKRIMKQSCQAIGLWKALLYRVTALFLGVSLTSTHLCMAFATSMGENSTAEIAGTTGPGLLKIEKIYFLIHPLLYRAPAPEPTSEDPGSAERYEQYAEYERKISPRWFDSIAQMGPNEVLVVGAPGCPKDLEEHVTQHLGRRGLVIRDVLTNQADLWERLSPEAKTGLGHDLLAMYWKHGFSWTSDPLTQPIIARGWAERIKETFTRRGLTFDPATVQAEAWGESFEGCVANYARYLGTYLDLAHPIEDNFELTVPDAPFLLTARFLERVPLDHSVRLYLWECPDSRYVALFQKAQASLGEPSLFVKFPLNGMRLEVRSRMDRPMWPRNLAPAPGSAAEAMERRLKKKQTPSWELRRREKGSTILEEDGLLKVPVPAPWVPDIAYIFVEDSSLDEFRSALVQVQFVEER
jgi:hypothetical protein